MVIFNLQLKEGPDAERERRERGRENACVQWKVILGSGVGGGRHEKCQAHYPGQAGMDVCACVCLLCAQSGGYFEKNERNGP